MARPASVECDRAVRISLDVHSLRLTDEQFYRLGSSIFRMNRRHKTIVSVVLWSVIMLSVCGGPHAQANPARAVPPNTQATAAQPPASRPRTRLGNQNL